ncbi:hypothetical protein V1478_017093 [Vespula squamosa]|uniref:Uncharacterized protein n=1 Tax=Vespula squamosa TaxID=30214 RepID=A0ABD2A0U0_VESSQ
MKDANEATVLQQPVGRPAANSQQPATSNQQASVNSHRQAAIGKQQAATKQAVSHQSRPHVVEDGRVGRAEGRSRICGPVTPTNHERFSRMENKSWLKIYDKKEENLGSSCTDPRHWFPVGPVAAPTTPRVSGVCNVKIGKRIITNAVSFLRIGNSNRWSPLGRRNQESAKIFAGEEGRRGHFDRYSPLELGFEGRISMIRFSVKDKFEKEGRNTSTVARKPTTAKGFEKGVRRMVYLRGGVA